MVPVGRLGAAALIFAGASFIHWLIACRLWPPTASSGRDDQYTRELRQLSGVGMFWGATAALIFMISAVLDLDAPIAWAAVLCLALVELPLIRWLGLRYPRSRLPTKWR
jgi:hypothetical protein